MCCLCVGEERVSKSTLNAGGSQAAGDESTQESEREREQGREREIKREFSCDRKSKQSSGGGRGRRTGSASGSSAHLANIRHLRPREQRDVTTPGPSPPTAPRSLLRNLALRGRVVLSGRKTPRATSTPNQLELHSCAARSRIRVAS